MRRPNYGTLEIALTIDDPKTYTRPFTVNLVQLIEPDTELVDEFCLEGEKSGRADAAKPGEVIGIPRDLVLERAIVIANRIGEAVLIAIIGATGNTGRAIVRELKALGENPLCTQSGQVARGAGRRCTHCRG